MRTGNKYKRITKKGRTWIVLESQKGQNLNLREVEDIQNGVMHNVIPIDVKIKGKKFTLTYDITNYIPLSQYTHTLINKKKFAEIVLQILKIFQNLTEACYNPQNLILDIDKVMVNPSTNQIFFLFVPILYYDSGLTRKEFLVQLIYHTTFDNTEDTGYVSRCLDILQKNMNFSSVELQEYVESLRDGERKNVNSGQQLDVPEEYNPLKQTNLRKNISNVGTVQNKDDLKDNAGNTKMMGTLSNVNRKDTIGLLGEEKSYVKQLRTGKKFYLEQPEITLGKKQCDVVITDNTAVSRKHAVIWKQDGRAYIRDLNSTNGTKVKGSPIQPEKAVMLKDEDEIELANEKFVFYK